ncbi:hypothetical protein [Rhodococcus globerulus]|uniref:hypothetical protein n=1 Tax=Rhodococcus globerulus TaxID=33008 RepID=UPI001F3147F6|nr:hypothetical protein [Rhodococcus globerulus]MCE4265286.1 hypothetical protein [Rhodococcus globerulus]
MTQWTFVNTDPHQFVVGTQDADTLAVKQSGALLEVGLGFATVLTGRAYGPVEVELTVLAEEPDTSEITEWEVVEEAPLRIDSSAQIMRLDGEQVERFPVIPAGRYRIRAHARGRDSAWDRQITVPVEQHMIWVWPETSRRGLRQLKKTDHAWDESAQDLTPNLGKVVFIDPDGTLRKLDPGSYEVQKAYTDMTPWEGREPSEKLRIHNTSQTLSRIDRRLLDVFESADTETLGEITAWSTRRACERAEIDQIDWVAKLLALVDEGVDLTEHISGSLYDTLWRDKRITRRIRHGRHLSTDFVEQDAAIATISSTRYEDPLQRALETLAKALNTYGLDVEELVGQFLERFERFGR